MCCCARARRACLMPKVGGGGGGGGAQGERSRDVVKGERLSQPRIPLSRSLALAPVLPCLLRPLSGSVCPSFQLSFPRFLQPLRPGPLFFPSTLCPFVYCSRRHTEAPYAFHQPPLFAYTSLRLCFEHGPGSGFKLALPLRVRPTRLIVSESPRRRSRARSPRCSVPGPAMGPALPEAPGPRRAATASSFHSESSPGLGAPGRAGPIRRSWWSACQ